MAELNARIQEIRRALRATEDAPAVIPVAVVPVTRKPRRKKRVISAEGRRNIIEATKSSELVRQEKFSEILRSPPTGFHLLPVAEAIPPRKGEFRFCRFSKCVCSS